MEIQLKGLWNGVLDVLDLKNLFMIGGGVGDIFGEDIVIEDQMFIFWVWIVVR